MPSIVRRKHCRPFWIECLYKKTATSFRLLERQETRKQIVERVAGDRTLAKWRPELPGDVLPAHTAHELFDGLVHGRPYEENAFGDRQPSTLEQ